MCVVGWCDAHVVLSYSTALKNERFGLGVAQHDSKSLDFKLHPFEGNSQFSKERSLVVTGSF